MINLLFLHSLSCKSFCCRFSRNLFHFSNENIMKSTVWIILFHEKVVVTRYEWTKWRSRELSKRGLWFSPISMTKPIDCLNCTKVVLFGFYCIPFFHIQFFISFKSTFWLYTQIPNKITNILPQLSELAGEGKQVNMFGPWTI